MELLDVVKLYATDRFDYSYNEDENVLKVWKIMPVEDIYLIATYFIKDELFSFNDYRIPADVVKEILLLEGIVKYYQRKQDDDNKILRGMNIWKKL